jgi:hypothetical protein
LQKGLPAQTEDRRKRQKWKSPIATAAACLRLLHWWCHWTLESPASIHSSSPFSGLPSFSFPFTLLQKNKKPTTLAPTYTSTHTHTHTHTQFLNSLLLLLIPTTKSL